MRYFPNPYPDYNASVPVPILHKEQIKAQLLDTAKIVFSKKGSDCDGGIYVGAGGYAYAYLHMRHALTPEENQFFLPLALKFYENHVRYHELQPVRDYRLE